MVLHSEIELNLNNSLNTLGCSSSYHDFNFHSQP